MKIPWQNQQYEGLIWATLGFLSFVLFLGAAPLFDWDEINFAESAREMIVSGDYFRVQINFEPFWEKPPLFFWMQVLSMKIFGINEFAARFPNALIGFATLMALFHWGKQFKDARFGRILVLLYLGSLLPHLYFKSGIIDPSFNLFIFLGLMHLIRYEAGDYFKGGEKVRQMAPWKAGFWLGIATLTKGPVAILIFTLTYLIYKGIRDRFRLPWLAIGKFTLLYLAVIVAWFGSLVLFTEEGIEMVRKFIVYQLELFSQPVAGHEQPFFYHFLVFIVGCFPLAAFAFRGMFLRFVPSRDRILKTFMLIWFWVVMILFSIVKTKIVHYSSMLYFPGVFLAGYYLWDLVEGRKQLKWDNYLLYGLGVVVFGLALTLLPLLTQRLPEIAAGLEDPFAKSNLLADVPWSGWEFLPGLVYLLIGLGGLFLLVKKRFMPFLVLFAVGSSLFLNLLNAWIAPKVAGYTQKAATDFYQKHAGEEVYFMVAGYKSYAHYFYGKVEPWPHPEIPQEERGAWMARGQTDRPVLLVTKNVLLKDDFEVSFHGFKELYRQDGFVFLRREAKLPSKTN